MKKIISIIVVLMVILSTMCNVSANSDKISVYLDAQKINFDVNPQIIDGRTMVPIRAIFEAMGANVEWNQNTKTAICTKENIIVKMTVGSMDMYINDTLTKMDAMPVVINGRTLAPARYVAEAFGANVQWSQENNSVVICSKDVFAYADYPDIPDLGKCYNIPLYDEYTENGSHYMYYIYNDFDNDEYYSYLYDNSALVLGNYAEELFSKDGNTITLSYTKPNEETPRYFIVVTQIVDGTMIFGLLIPNDKLSEPTVTLYALDGRTLEVSESEVPAQLTVGWYKTLEETQQTLFAADGRTITVFKSEVPAYLNVGWYRTQAEAIAANQTYVTPETTITQQTTVTPQTSNSQTQSGRYYRTPTGKRYHLDPDCGGKNSYVTSDITGLTPCAKCAK